MYYINKVMYVLHGFLVIFAKIQLVSMCLIVSVNVFCRYVLNHSIFWSDEVALLLVVWFSFIGMALAVMDKLHIAIQLFMSKCSENVDKNIVQKFTDLMILLYSLVLIFYGFNLFRAGLTNTLPSTGMPTAVVYGVLPFSGILIFYESFTNLFGLKKFKNNQCVDELESSEDKNA
ncbi:MAG: TRAP transporter small permease [Spirochaetes bacterium]|nr:TRAP transporter small permease [Spirochaetota bacterium]